MKYRQGFAAAVLFAGLGTAHVATAAPFDIESLIAVDELDENAAIVALGTPDRMAWADASVTTLHSFSQTKTTSFGSLRTVGGGTANAQAVWGNVAESQFYLGGVLTTSYYAASFVREAGMDVLNTRISNTAFNVRDFGGEANGLPVLAGLNFGAFFRAGGHGGLDAFDVGDPGWVLGMSAEIGVKGRAGPNGGTLGDPDAGPFRLFGNSGLFPGTYSEEGSFFGTNVHGATYELDTTTLSLALPDFIDVGDIFSVVWEATSAAVTQGGETEARTRFWDPLGTGSFYSFSAAGPVTPPTPPPVGMSLPGVLTLLLAGVVGIWRFGAQSPTATGRFGSRIHSLHEPA